MFDVVRCNRYMYNQVSDSLTLIIGMSKQIDHLACEDYVQLIHHNFSLKRRSQTHTKKREIRIAHILSYW